jgi:hypothetical protein
VFKHGLDLNVDILFLPKYEYVRAAAINTYTVKFSPLAGRRPNFPPSAEQLGQPAAAGFQPAASAASAGQAGTLAWLCVSRHFRVIITDLSSDAGREPVLNTYTKSVRI